MTQLDIFAHRFGDEAHPGSLRADDENTLGLAGVRMLESIQTVVDVLADEVNGSYVVGFADFDSAMTDHKRKRIVISGKPLTGAKTGTPYRDIAAILTGFAVHEVGHTKRVGIIKAVNEEWPGKKLPHTLGNIIEDIVLEARTIEAYAGFRDVFDDAFKWVADKTCPKYPIAWGGSSGDKVNFAGQVARYRPFVSFAGDARTQEELLWWEDWTNAITSKMTPSEAVEHVKAALLRIAANVEPETEEPPTGCGNGPTTEGGEEPPTGEGKGEKPPKGDGKGDEPGNPTIPNEEDDDDPEGGNGSGEDDDPEGDDPDGEGKGDDDGDDDGGDTEGGDDDGPGKGKGTDKVGDNLADTNDRKDGGKGSTDGPGKGGSGQTIAEASDPADFDESKVTTFDDAIEVNRNENYVLQNAVNVERTTARLDGGIHGKMRVIFK